MCRLGSVELDLDANFGFDGIGNEAFLVGFIVHLTDLVACWFIIVAVTIRVVHWDQCDWMPRLPSLCPKISAEKLIACGFDAP